MSFDSLPEEIENGVREFAEQKRISQDEAVQHLLLDALSRQAAPKLNSNNSKEEISSDTEPPSIIGLFKNDPEWDEIMDSIVRSRNERYA